MSVHNQKHDEVREEAPDHQKRLRRHVMSRCWQQPKTSKTTYIYIYIYIIYLVYYVYICCVVPPCLFSRLSPSFPIYLKNAGFYCHWTLSRPSIYICPVCVFFTLHRYFYPSTSSTNNQRPCRESSILEEMHVPWPQNYATERDTTYEVRCYACSINKHSSIDSSALLPMQCIISMCVYLHPETISLLIGTIRTLRTHGTHEELSTFFWLSTFRIAVSLWGQLGANHLKFDWFAPKTTLQS